MSYSEDIDAIKGELRSLNQLIPGATKSFANLSKSVKDSGTISLKEKEFVALGIAVAQRCMPCISFHVKALIKAGATREELGDVLAVAIQMGGGPSLMYSAHALACWDELTAK